MGLSIISSEKREQEIDIQKEIFNSIDQNENIIFSSGAGSGKTYSLVESLKHIINKHGSRLKVHNQKIVCITYTNVAVEEVKNRLGNSDLVLVSTIHERIWELIKDYQKELVKIHQYKLNEEISILNNKLDAHSKFAAYRNLNNEQKSGLADLMISQTELFYKSQDENAGKFREIFGTQLKDFPNILKNYSDFKELIKIIYKINNYAFCLQHIDDKKEGYLKVKYNASYNSDRLHWMRISHDTLLEYGIKIIKSHNVLQQIIIDQHPYFLIDEYQDTEKTVIEIMSILTERSKEIKHPFFVGYFGDPAQNIYDGGIGKNISKVHPNLKAIIKPFNRRSTEEVVTIINAIRNDEIKQSSIYDDSKGGSVKFYAGQNEKIDTFIEKYKSKWGISLKNKLHCFVLTNKSVAEYSGFSNIYAFFANTKKYKIGYQQLNTELLSDNQVRLGEIPSFIYRILEFKSKLNLKNTPIQDLLNKHIYSDMDMGLLRAFITSLKNIKGNTLNELLESITDFYTSTENKKHKELITQLFDFEGFPDKSVKSYLSEILYPNIKEEDITETTKAIEAFLNINFNEFELWYKYILRENETDVVYHTYHGTKGLEFDNVVILIGNAFGRNQMYFKNFFMSIQNASEAKNEYYEEFEQTKNLLYVACSRAIKNLRILYVDDVSDFKDALSEIFIDVKSY
ncbi:ATP-dependent helicase [Flavobacterium sufflavum]|uniref:ATP-dependent helicase n=1 Tax=Flavobacterium sufflavum TaxID=1921138 RepID=A0A437KXS8_9FLAO|nr:ATP-dependent helicase [Flavobacterium sufflavum]RVT77362.1 ATP-dependent helicase [Flavobacterium sufflavum]